MKYKLFIVAPSIHSRYRPDPTKSVQEELYTKSANPLPALQVMSRIYAMHASGLVRFWVEDEADLASLRSSLQVGAAICRYRIHSNERIVWVQVNPSNAKATFVQITQTKWFLKTI